MKDEEIKKKLFTRLYNSVPKGIWAISASISLLIFTSAVSLNFAHIRADDFINKYMEIKLKEIEMNNPTHSIKELEQRIIQLEQDNIKLKQLSHEAG